MNLNVPTISGIKDGSSSQLAVNGGSNVTRSGSLNSLGVPAPAFPMAGSAQIVSGTGKTERKKVQLKPGHSLMDWIRFGRNTDLSGTGGKKVIVSKEELATHNKLDDIWMSIRGLVYNITPYMDFHPGGMDELMRAAGGDGTTLFDEIHRWVNVESMLQKCLIGPLKDDEPPSHVKPVTPSPTNSAKPMNGPPPTFVVPVVQPTAEIMKPRFDWFETDDTIIIVIYTKCKKLRSEDVIIDYLEGELKITVCVEDHQYFVHYNIKGKIQNEFKVSVTKSVGKAEVKFKKSQPGDWSSLGEALSMNDTFKPHKSISTLYRNCKIVSIEKVSHDTNLYCIGFPEYTRMCIPIGYHCIIKSSIEGMEVSRSYTICPPSLLPETQDPLVAEGKRLYCMIKIYPDGALTPKIGQLQVGDQIEMSSFEGNFDGDRLHEVDTLVLIAAGTGFTPMTRLILHSIFLQPMENRTVKMMFFNKELRDILWKDELEEVQRRYPRFELSHVLSRPHNEWTGLTGRIRKELLDDFLPKPKNDKTLLLCACGPDEFTSATMRLAREYGYTDNMLHAFLA